MTIAQSYFQHQYDVYLRLKSQLELQDLESELSFENQEIEKEAFETNYSDDFLDFIDEFYQD